MSHLSPTSRFDATHPVGRIAGRWPWMFALGLALIALGLLAFGMVLAASIASVFMIGVSMAAMGLLEIGIGLGSRSWSRFFLWVIAGLLYLLAGFSIMAQPLMAAAVFTLLLGAGLVATGLVRIWTGFQFADGRRRMLVASGLLTTVLGLLILTGWPANSAFVLGLMLGCDLIVYGVSWLGVGLMLRRFAQAAG